MLVDRIILACAVLVAALYLYGSTQIPSLEIGDPLGPKAFPQLLGIGLLIASAMLGLEMWRSRARNTPEVERYPFEPRVIAVLAAVVVWTGVYYLVFIDLGYIVATALYLLPLMAYFNRGKWVPNIVTAALFPNLTYWLFTQLDVSLPRGILPF